VLKNYIINTASGFIYSTATTPANAACVSKAWDLIKDMDEKRAALQLLSKQLRTTLKTNGFNIGASQTHIIPIILGSEERAMAAKQFLLEHKILLSSIRPPTVPPGSSRLRIALNLSHTQSDIDKLIKTLSML
jgi:8-amino-7-oxononanoate synthase